MDTSGKYPELSNSDPLFEVAEYTQLMNASLNPTGALPVFASGWSDFNAGGYNRALTKEIVGGVFTLTGMIKGGTLTDGVHILTIPVSHRPNVSVYAGCTIRAGSVQRPGMISISGSGIVYLFGELAGTSYVLLNTIYHKAN